MSALEKIVKYNAQTIGREKLIRRYSKGGVELLELLYKLRELEQYFISCRRLVSFGRCTDQLYSAIRSMQLNDPIVRITSATSKLWLSFQMFSDHILWLDQMGLLKDYNKQLWVERANKFWLYSVGANLLRDFYELICVVQKQRSRDKDKMNCDLEQFDSKTPIKWIRGNPKLSCDLIKNFCDFWIPFTAVNKVYVHPSAIAMLGIVSTTMGILQVYDRDLRLSPS